MEAYLHLQSSTSIAAIILCPKTYERLRPGGVILVSRGLSDWNGADRYYGVSMACSHLSSTVSFRMVMKARFEVLFDRPITPGDETHYWTLARKMAY